ncbi:MAG: GTP-binding protein [Bacteriovoracia bacterium]
MSFVNYHSKEINCKIVYYGPGFSGKTTNLQHIYQKTSTDSKGELVSLSTENERTLFFDFLPLDLGDIRGFKTRFHLYTVPGQVFYESSRKLILRGVDGVVFVADSQIDRMEENIQSLESLKQNLDEQGYDFNRVPIVFQWNKRDLGNIVTAQEMQERLNERNAPAIETIATNGQGVFESLKTISKLVLLNIKGGLE